MGTRGLLGFVADKREVFTYNHWDSYPEGLGLMVLGFLRQLVKDDAVESAARRVRELLVVDEHTPITPEMIERLKPWTDTGVGRAMHLADQPPDSWYQLGRKAQGDPDAILSAGVAEDSADFALDSLFCEWAYVIDFDEQVLEVYQGFQEQPPTAGRWVGKIDPEALERRSSLGSTYYPINQVAVFSLASLPIDDEFLDTVQGPSDAEG